MPRPSCEQKERLLSVYMEAVGAHYEIVGQLRAVRDEPESFSTVLGKAKEAYAQVLRDRAELERHCKEHGC
jgi:ferritin